MTITREQIFFFNGYVRGYNQAQRDPVGIPDSATFTKAMVAAYELFVGKWNFDKMLKWVGAILRNCREDANA